MTPDDAPPGAVPTGDQARGMRRLLGPVLRPLRDALDVRFAQVDTRLDAIEASVAEVRDRVETDLATLVELTIELRRMVDALEEETRRDPNG